MNLDEVREEVYLRRLEAERLRRLVYEQPDPAESAELGNSLDAAEEALRAAEKTRDEVESRDPSRGLVLDTAQDTGLLGPETTGLEAEVRLRMEHLPTAIAHLLESGSNPLVTCRIRNAQREGTRRLRVTSLVDGYTGAAIETIELEPLGEHLFDLLPVLRRESVRDVSELTRATLSVLVEDLDGAVELHRTVPVWLLPRTSAPLAVRDPASGKWRDMTPYFGAFVTPNAPEVMSFLRKVAEHHPDKRLVGYQGDKSSVEPQVRAVFDALKAEANITYVNSVIAFSPEEGPANQRIRLPRESLQDGQANCVDGTVLFASLLEGMSMSPAIVVVPGHAFLAWETWRKSETWRYVETTMINSHSFEEACESAEETAARYIGAAADEPTAFRRWPLRTLRSTLRITPME